MECRIFSSVSVSIYADGAHAYTIHIIRDASTHTCGNLGTEVFSYLYIGKGSLENKRGHS